MLQSDERLHRLERLTELPLLVLALSLVPLLVLPEVATLGDTTKQAFLAADWLIWGVFATDFALKLAVAPRRFEYARRNWLEVLMVLLPFLRPLRVFRVVRFLRVATAIGFNVDLIRDILSTKGTRFIALAVVTICVAGGTLTFLAERQEETSNINSFGDAVWWSLVTMSTVGYGDHYPVSPLGRGVAVTLMFLGIAALSAVTASIAAFLVRGDDEDAAGSQLSEVIARLDEVQAEVVALRRELARARG